MNQLNNSKGAISLRRSVAVLATALVFLCQDILFFPSQLLASEFHSDSVRRGISQGNLHSSAPEKEIVVPAELGFIESKYAVSSMPYGEKTKGAMEREEEKTAIAQPAYSPPQPKTIVFIQDAHDSLEAQENIAGILRLLVEQYGVRTVFEEGGEGRVPAEDYFRFIPTREKKEEVAYFLMDKLRLSGAEFAHVTRRKDFRLVGADNKALRKENLEAYRSASRLQPRILKDLETIERELLALAHQVFPKALKEWMRWKEAQSRDELPFFDYAKRTYDLARSQKLQEKDFPILQALFARSAEEPSRPDTQGFFADLARLEEALIRALIPSGPDHELFELYRWILLVKRLNALQVSSEEYAVVEERIRTLNTQRAAEFLLTRTGRPYVFSKRWELAMREAIRFYEVAHRRDEVLERTIARFGAQREERIAALVFGGFHAARIKALLRKQKMSYIVITPAITKTSERHRYYYRALMRKGLHDFEIPLQVAKALSPERLADLPDPGSEVRAIYDTMARLGIRGLGESSVLAVDLGLRTLARGSAPSVAVGKKGTALGISNRSLRRAEVREGIREQRKDLGVLRGARPEASAKTGAPKIVLVHVGKRQDNAPNFPTALYALKSYLEQRYQDQVDVRVLDMQIEDAEEIAGWIAEWKPDMLGLSLIAGEMGAADRLIALVKAKLPPQERPLMVFGKNIPTFAPGELLKKYPEAICVRGEGELAIGGLVEYLRGKRPLADIPNVVYMQEGLITESRAGRKVLSSLSSLGKIAYSAAWDYIRRGGNFWMETARGCPWGVCTFCSTRIFWGTKKRSVWRSKTIPHILAELEQLAARGIRRVTFTDEEFFGGGPEAIRNAKDLALAILKNKIKISFYINVRADFIYNENDDRKTRRAKQEALRLLRKAGLQIAFVGLETGSREQNKRYGKGVSLEEAEKAIRICRSMRVDMALGWIMLEPLVSREEILESIAFIRRNKILPFLSTPLNQMRLYPGITYLTMLRNEEKKLGRKLVGDEMDLDSLTYETVGYKYPEMGVVARAAKAYSEGEYDLYNSIKWFFRFFQNAPRREYDYLRTILESLKALQIELLETLCRRPLEDLMDEAKVRQVYQRAIERRKDLIARMRDLIVSRGHATVCSGILGQTEQLLQNSHGTPPFLLTGQLPSEAPAPITEEVLTRKNVFKRFGRGARSRLPKGPGFYGIGTAVMLPADEKIRQRIAEIRKTLEKTQAFRNGKIKWVPHRSLHHTLQSLSEWGRDRIRGRVFERHARKVRQTLDGLPAGAIYFEGVALGDDYPKLVLKGHPSEDFRALEAKFRTPPLPRTDMKFGVVVEALTDEEFAELKQTVEKLSKAPIGLASIDEISVLAVRDHFARNLSQRKVIRLGPKLSSEDRLPRAQRILRRDPRTMSERLPIRMQGRIGRPQPEVLRQYRAEVRNAGLPQEETIPLAAPSLPLRAVVFDIGNVLIRLDFLGAARAFLAEGAQGVTVEAIRRRLYDSKEYHLYETGRRSIGEYSAWICGALGIGAMSPEKFKELWSRNMLEAIHGTVALARRLKEAGYKVFFLSDTNPLHMEYAYEHYDFFDVADHVFTSYELGARKGHGLEAFRILGERTGIPLDRMIFFDDLEKNVRFANQAGLPARVFTTPEQAEQELAKLGIVLPPARAESRHGITRAEGRMFDAGFYAWTAYEAGTWLLGVILAKHAGDWILNEIRKRATQVGPFRAKKKMLVLVSGADPNSQENDLIAIPIALRPYWWLKGYELEVVTDARIEDLAKALLSDQVPNIALMGHGAWDAWEATDGAVYERDLAKVMERVAHRKSLFITYTCGHDRFSIDNEAEEKFGYSAVKDPETQLKGTAGRASTHWWFDRPGLFLMSHLKPKNAFARAMHSSLYQTANHIGLVLVMFSFSALIYFLIDNVSLLILTGVAALQGFASRGLTDLLTDENLRPFMYLSAFVKSGILTGIKYFNAVRPPRRAEVRSAPSRTVFEGRPIAALLENIAVSHAALLREAREAESSGQDKVAAYARIGLAETALARLALEDLRDRGLRVSEEAGLLIKTYSVWDRESEGFQLEDIPEFKIIEEGGAVRTGPHAGQVLGKNFYRAHHIRRVQTFFRALTAGNYGYYLRRLAPGEDPVRYEAALRVIKQQYDRLSPSEKKMIWAEIKLHDIGYAEDVRSIGHEERGAQRARSILREQASLSEREIETVSRVIEKHTLTGMVYLGTTRMEELLKVGNETELRLLLLHNLADGPSAGIGEMRMTAAQIEAVGSWFDPAKQRAMTEDFAAYRLSKTARVSMIARDLDPTELVKLEGMTDEVFGHEKEEILRSIRHRLDIADGTGDVFYRLAVRDPSYRDFAKFWKLLACLGGMVESGEVTLRSDLLEPIAGISREKSIALRVEKVADRIAAAPSDFDLVSTRARLRGLPENETVEFYGLPLRRTGNAVTIETGPLISPSANIVEEKDLPDFSGKSYTLTAPALDPGTIELLSDRGALGLREMLLRPENAEAGSVGRQAIALLRFVEGRIEVALVPRVQNGGSRNSHQDLAKRLAWSYPWDGMAFIFNFQAEGLVPGTHLFSAHSARLSETAFRDQVIEAARLAQKILEKAGPEDRKVHWTNVAGVMRVMTPDDESRLERREPEDFAITIGSIARLALSSEANTRAEVRYEPSKAQREILEKLHLEWDPAAQRLRYGKDFSPLPLRSKLIYVRHGNTLQIEEILKGAPIRFQGNVDEPQNQLSPTGHRQAEDLVPKLQRILEGEKGKRIRFFSSPRHRAVDTARPAQKGMGFKLEIRPNLHEMSFGESENLSEAEIEAKLELGPEVADRARAYREHNPFVAQPGGESFLDLLWRARQELLDLDRILDGDTGVLFAHGTLGLACKLLFGEPGFVTASGHLEWRHHPPQTAEPFVLFNPPTVPGTEGTGKRAEVRKGEPAFVRAPDDPQRTETAWTISTEEVETVEEEIRSIFEKAEVPMRFYTEWRKGTFAPSHLGMLPELAEKLGLRRGQPATLLDAGHGQLQVLLALALMNPDLHLIGIEAHPEIFSESEEILEEARKRHPRLKDQIEIHHGDLTSQALAGLFRQTDAVYYFGMGSHAEYLLLKTLSENLRDGARLLVYKNDSMIRELLRGDPSIRLSPEGAVRSEGAQIHAYVRRAETRVSAEEALDRVQNFISEFNAAMEEIRRKSYEIPPDVAGAYFHSVGSLFVSVWAESLIEAPPLQKFNGILAYFRMLGEDLENFSDSVKGKAWAVHFHYQYAKTATALSVQGQPMSAKLEDQKKVADFLETARGDEDAIQDMKGLYAVWQRHQEPLTAAILGVLGEAEETGFDPRAEVRGEKESSSAGPQRIKAHGRYIKKHDFAAAFDGDIHIEIGARLEQSPGLFTVTPLSENKLRLRIYIKKHDLTAAFDGDIHIEIGARLEQSPALFTVTPLSENKLRLHIQRGELEEEFNDIEIGKTYIVARKKSPDRVYKADELILVDEEVISEDRHFSFKVFPREGRFWFLITDYGSTNGTTVTADIYTDSISFSKDLAEIVKAQIEEILQPKVITHYWSDQPEGPDPDALFSQGLHEVDQLYRASMEFQELEPLRHDLIKDYFITNMVGASEERYRMCMVWFSRYLMEDRLTLWMPVLEQIVKNLRAFRYLPDRLKSILSNKKFEEAPSWWIEDLRKALAAQKIDPEDLGIHLPQRVGDWRRDTVKLKLPPPRSAPGNNLRAEVREGGLFTDSGQGLVAHGTGREWARVLDFQREHMARTEKFVVNIRESLRRSGVDPARVTRAVYPAGGQDVMTLLSLAAIFENLKEIEVISLYEGGRFDERIEREAQERIKRDFREIAQKLKQDVSRVKIRVRNRDYYETGPAVAGESEPDGLTVIVDKIPGYRSTMRLDPRFRDALLRDTRPGDLLFAFRDSPVPPLQWTFPPLAEGLELPYLYDFRNWQIHRFAAADYAGRSQETAGSAEADLRSTVRHERPRAEVRGDFTARAVSRNKWQVDLRGVPWMGYEAEDGTVSIDFAEPRDSARTFRGDPGEVALALSRSVPFDGRGPLALFVGHERGRFFISAEPARPSGPSDLQYGISCSWNDPSAVTKAIAEVLNQAVFETRADQVSPLSAEADRKQWTKFRKKEHKITRWLLAIAYTIAPTGLIAGVFAPNMALTYVLSAFGAFFILPRVVRYLRENKDLEPQWEILGKASEEHHLLDRTPEEGIEAPQAGIFRGAAWLYRLATEASPLKQPFLISGIGVAIFSVVDTLSQGALLKHVGAFLDALDNANGAVMTSSAWMVGLGIVPTLLLANWCLGQLQGSMKYFLETMVTPRNFIHLLRRHEPGDPLLEDAGQRIGPDTASLIQGSIDLFVLFFQAAFRGSFFILMLWQLTSWGLVIVVLGLLPILVGSWIAKRINEEIEERTDRVATKEGLFRALIERTKRERERQEGEMDRARAAAIWKKLTAALFDLEVERAGIVSVQSRNNFINGGILKVAEYLPYLLIIVPVLGKEIGWGGVAIILPAVALIQGAARFYMEKATEIARLLSLERRVLNLYGAKGGSAASSQPKKTVKRNSRSRAEVRDLKTKTAPAPQRVRGRHEPEVVHVGQKEKTARPLEQPSGSKPYSSIPYIRERNSTLAYPIADVNEAGRGSPAEDPRVESALPGFEPGSVHSRMSRSIHLSYRAAQPGKTNIGIINNQQKYVNKEYIGRRIDAGHEITRAEVRSVPDPQKIPLGFNAKLERALSVTAGFLWFSLALLAAKLLGEVAGGPSAAGFLIQIPIFFVIAMPVVLLSAMGLMRLAMRGHPRALEDAAAKWEQREYEISASASFGGSLDEKSAHDLSPVSRQPRAEVREGPKATRSRPAFPRGIKYRVEMTRLFHVLRAVQKAESPEERDAVIRERLIDWQLRDGGELARFVDGRIAAPAQMILGHLDEPRIVRQFYPEIVDFFMRIPNRRTFDFVLTELAAAAAGPASGQRTPARAFLTGMVSRRMIRTNAPNFPWLERFLRSKHSEKGGYLGKLEAAYRFNRARVHVAFEGFSAAGPVAGGEQIIRAHRKHPMQWAAEYEEDPVFFRKSHRPKPRKRAEVRTAGEDERPGTDLSKAWGRLLRFLRNISPAVARRIKPHAKRDPTELEIARRQREWWTKKSPAWTTEEIQKMPAILRALYENGINLKGGVVQNNKSPEAAALVESVSGFPRTPASVYAKALVLYRGKGGWPQALQDAGLDLGKIAKLPGAIEERNMRLAAEEKKAAEEAQKARPRFPWLSFGPKPGGRAEVREGDAEEEKSFNPYPLLLERNRGILLAARAEMERAVAVSGPAVPRILDLYRDSLRSAVLVGKEGRSYDLRWDPSYPTIFSHLAFDIFTGQDRAGVFSLRVQTDGARIILTESVYLWPEHQGQGLSGQILALLREATATNLEVRMQSVIANIPTLREMNRLLPARQQLGVVDLLARPEEGVDNFFSDDGTARRLTENFAAAWRAGTKPSLSDILGTKGARRLAHFSPEIRIRLEDRFGAGHNIVLESDLQPGDRTLRAEARIAGIPWSPEAREAVLQYHEALDKEARQKLARLVQSTALQDKKYLAEGDWFRYPDTRLVLWNETEDLLRNFSRLRDVLAGFEGKYEDVADGLEKTLQPFRAEVRSQGEETAFSWPGLSAQESRELDELRASGSRKYPGWLRMIRLIVKTLPKKDGYSPKEIAEASRGAFTDKQLTDAIDAGTRYRGRGSGPVYRQLKIQRRKVPIQESLRTLEKAVRKLKGGTVAEILEETGMGESKFWWLLKKPGVRRKMTDQGLQLPEEARDGQPDDRVSKAMEALRQAGMEITVTGIVSGAEGLTRRQVQKVLNRWQREKKIPRAVADPERDARETKREKDLVATIDRMILETPWEYITYDRLAAALGLNKPQLSMWNKGRRKKGQFFTAASGWRSRLLLLQKTFGATDQEIAEALGRERLDRVSARSRPAMIARVRRRLYDEPNAAKMLWQPEVERIVRPIAAIAAREGFLRGQKPEGIFANFILMNREEFLQEVPRNVAAMFLRRALMAGVYHEGLASYARELKMGRLAEAFEKVREIAAFFDAAQKFGMTPEARASIGLPPADLEGIGERPYGNVARAMLGHVAAVSSTSGEQVTREKTIVFSKLLEAARKYDPEAARIFAFLAANAYEETKTLLRFYPDVLQGFTATQAGQAFLRRFGYDHLLFEEEEEEVEDAGRAEVRAVTTETMAIPLHLGEKHDEAFTWFKSQIDAGVLPRGLTLVLFDSHADAYDDLALNPTNWVFHLLKEGYVSNILWVLPPWARTLPGDSYGAYEGVAEQARELFKKYGILPSAFSWCFLDEMPVIDSPVLASVDYDFLSRDEDTIYRAGEEEIRELASAVFETLEDRGAHVLALDLTRSGEPYTFPDQVPFIEAALRSAIRGHEAGALAREENSGRAEIREEPVIPEAEERVAIALELEGFDRLAAKFREKRELVVTRANGEAVHFAITLKTSKPYELELEFIPEEAPTLEDLVKALGILEHSVVALVNHAQHLGAFREWVLEKAHDVKLRRKGISGDYYERARGAKQKRKHAMAKKTAKAGTSERGYGRGKEPDSRLGKKILDLIAKGKNNKAEWKRIIQAAARILGENATYAGIAGLTGIGVVSLRQAVSDHRLSPRGLGIVLERNDAATWRERIREAAQAVRGRTGGTPTLQTAAAEMGMTADDLSRAIDKHNLGYFAMDVRPRYFRDPEEFWKFTLREIKDLKAKGSSLDAGNLSRAMGMEPSSFIKSVRKAGLKSRLIGEGFMYGAKPARWRKKAAEEKGGIKGTRPAEREGAKDGVSSKRIKTPRVLSRSEVKPASEGSPSPVMEKVVPPVKLSAPASEISTVQSPKIPQPAPSFAPVAIPEEMHPSLKRILRQFNDGLVLESQGSEILKTHEDGAHASVLKAWRYAMEVKKRFVPPLQPGGVIGNLLESARLTPGSFDVTAWKAARDLSKKLQEDWAELEKRKDPEKAYLGAFLDKTRARLKGAAEELERVGLARGLLVVEPEKPKQRSRKRAEVRSASIWDFSKEAVFTLEASALESMSRAEVRELLTVAGLHRKNLKILITGETVGALSATAQERLSDLSAFGNVLSEEQARRLSPTALRIGFVSGGKTPERRFGEKYFAEVREGNFGLALLFAQNEGVMPGVQPDKKDILRDLTGEWLDRITGELRSTAVAVARSA